MTDEQHNIALLAELSSGAKKAESVPSKLDPIVLRRFLDNNPGEAGRLARQADSLTPVLNKDRNAKERSFPVLKVGSDDSWFYNFSDLKFALRQGVTKAVRSWYSKGGPIDPTFSPDIVTSLQHNPGVVQFVVENVIGDWPSGGRKRLCARMVENKKWDVKQSPFPKALNSLVSEGYRNELRSCLGGQKFNTLLEVVYRSGDELKQVSEEQLVSFFNTCIEELYDCFEHDRSDVDLLFDNNTQLHRTVGRAFMKSLINNGFAPTQKLVSQKKQDNPDWFERLCDLLPDRSGRTALINEL